MHEPFAGIGDLLFFLAGVAKLLVLPIEHGTGALVGAFQLVQLVVDALAQVLGVHVAGQKLGAPGPPQFAQRQVKWVVLGVGIEALEHSRGRDVLLLKADDEPQDSFSLRLNQSPVQGFARPQGIGY